MSRKNVPTILKETDVDRKERLKYAQSMSTKVVPNKKYKSREQQKREDRKTIENS